ncbi:hypothetical protein J2S67_000103 [Pseudoglutamicibacter albus]|uniref:Secreted protein n=2 Tax=Pseudoglutamicibacter albus TaxID=98671 RepID=A0ABU1YWV4_9MICC|nr:hypothetical protein [Pseudoglutamicibacter albus]
MTVALPNPATATPDAAPTAEATATEAEAPGELGAPGETQTVELGNGNVQYGLRLARDGGAGCIITKANGYEPGDNTPRDGNICAGDIAHYSIDLNVKTAGEPITFKLTPNLALR